MAKFNRPKSVPKSMRATHDAIVSLTDAFRAKHLNAEYRELARDMAAALCRKRSSPLASEQPRTWACGIVHELGRVNFLSDPSTQPHMTLAEVCAGFGVGQSTASEGARHRAGARGEPAGPELVAAGAGGDEPAGVDGRGQRPLGRPTRQAARCRRSRSGRG